ncbi:MAG: DUF2065 family protein [Alphaproteobacteria bacterium]|nr:DUF2065 family protein [Alphaproteobacteria bacterium]MBR6730745.1 DUF2065 family protein [Alphaproteobacteria bacterium]
MKHIVAAILILFIFRGVTYIFFPKGVKYIAQKMADIDDLSYRMYGWLLLFLSFIIWVSYLRHQF